MRNLVFAQSDKYPICILVNQIRKDDILKYYIDPYKVDASDVMVLDLHQTPGKKKTPAAEMKGYIQEDLQSVLDDFNVEYILVADADYFKTLTRAAKVEANLGYVMPSVFGPQKVIYIPNHQAVFYDPEKVISKISQGMQALIDHRNGDYRTPGDSIIHNEWYPDTDIEIEKALQSLLDMDCDLTCDIEGFGLKHHECGIGTITFCWNEHEGIAFPVDYKPIVGANEAPYGEYVHNGKRRQLLRNFFEKFQRKLIFHSISFDAYVLVYQLYMQHLLDTAGLLKGMEIILRDWDCTKLITYLATNSCAGNRLGLKIQAQEYAGNYAQDDEAIQDIRKIPLPQLLQYNLVDGLSTWFVHKKHWPTLVADQQEGIYREIFQPAMWEIIQMQLTGMPVNMVRALEVSDILTDELEQARNTIMSSPIIKAFTDDYLDPKFAEKQNAKWVKKRITASEANQTFNPNSDIQKRALLFEYLDLPVINLTDNKLPSTDGETVEALLNHVTDPEVKKLLEGFQLFNIIDVLTTNFMPAILGAVQAPDGWHYLYGNFNLGGTLSGRLSSSKPNLQNIPSTGKGHKIKLKYAKLIKSCFGAPKGWLFVGADFPSLEDRISALTTKDPNKLKVYMGHIVYEIIIDGTCHHIRDDATIIYDGNSYTGEEFYAKYGANS